MTISTRTPDIDILSLPTGTLVSFRSKNVNDTTLWTGTLIGSGSYQLFPDKGDFKPYNEAIRQSDNTVSSDITSLHYFALLITNNGVSRQAIFTKEWIADNSLKVLTQSIVQTVSVSDPYGDTNRLLNYIRTGGYAAQLTSS